MTREEAIEYAKTMTFRDAIYNLKQARCIPYKKATFIKINELLNLLEKNTEKELAESIISLIPHLPAESDKARIQIATEEKTCENCKYKCFREAYSCVETPCNACYEASHFATKEGD